MRHVFLLPFLFVLSACAGDKFPYPPQFVTIEAVPPTAVEAPPKPDSDTQKKEVEAIIYRQAHMSDADKQAVLAEDHISPAMIMEPALGRRYTKETHPALFTLLAHAASDAWRIGDNTQDYWGRTRPWLTDSRVQLLVSSIKRPSYPSGHSTTNHVWAHVLSELFPQKREAFFNRAYEIGMHRTHAGVHYPSDVEAGKELAEIIYQRMESSTKFRQELAAARAELKAPAAANDNLRHGTASNCNTPNAHTMVMCK